MDYSNKYVPKSLSEKDKKLQKKQLKKYRVNILNNK